MRTTAILLLTLLCGSYYSSAQDVVANRTPVANDTAQAVRWYTFEEALALNAKQPRKILMDVFTDWCGWCKVLDSKTFSHPVIAQYLNENFYAVKFDAEQLPDVVYMGKTFKNQKKGNKSAHDFIVALTQGKLSYPTMVFFDGESKPLTVVPGFHTPEQLEPILVFLAEDKYKVMDFETFTKTFVSRIAK